MVCLLSASHGPIAPFSHQPSLREQLLLEITVFCGLPNCMALFHSNDASFDNSLPA